jgi:hypothetical protein
VADRHHDQGANPHASCCREIDPRVLLRVRAILMLSGSRGVPRQRSVQRQPHADVDGHDAAGRPADQVVCLDQLNGGSIGGGQPLCALGNHLHDRLQIQLNSCHVALCFDNFRKKCRLVGEQVCGMTVLPAGWPSTELHCCDAPEAKAGKQKQFCGACLKYQEVPYMRGRSQSIRQTT